MQSLAQILRCLRSRTFRSDICLGQTTIHDKVRRVDEATFIASQEDDGMGLLNRFSKATGREMDLDRKSVV